MATAVFHTGGKQYRVSEGDTLKLEKLAGQPGESVEFGEVLFLGGDEPKLGKPFVSGAKVTGTITAQGRHKSLVIFKFKRRKRYKRKAGHRQHYTEVKITGITG